MVIPQFLVTGLSSILFALLEPDKSVIDQGHAGHPHAGNVPVGNSTHVEGLAPASLLFARQAEVESAGSGPDSIGIIFRYVHYVSPSAHGTDNPCPGSVESRPPSLQYCAGD